MADSGTRRSAGGSHDAQYAPDLWKVLHSSMLIVIDNYDSFTFNLVQFLGDLGEDPLVVRNDERTVAELVALHPTRVVVSPGPCAPSAAGISIEAFQVLGEAGIPMLGVCLGHQSLGEAFGGRTIRAARLMHGKTGAVRHDGSHLFRDVPSPFRVARYHSLVTDPAALPDVLVPIAWSDDGDDADEVQAMRHRTLPLWGVQFHPESMFSEYGRQILSNFVTAPPNGLGSAGSVAKAASTG